MKGKESSSAEGASNLGFFFLKVKGDFPYHILLKTPEFLWYTRIHARLVCVLPLQ